MKKESNSDEKNILKSETNEDMIDWWVGTVILTFFPILTSIIINICRNGYADFIVVQLSRQKSKLFIMN